MEEAFMTLGENSQGQAEKADPRNHTKWHERKRIVRRFTERLAADERG